MEPKAPILRAAQDALARGDYPSVCQLPAGFEEPAAHELLAHAHGQLGNIRRKLRQRTRAAAVAQATRDGLI